MKITRTPTKKLAPLPSALADIVEHLINDDQDQIKKWTSLPEWNFPRSDLFQFTSVLNRFDNILETTCQEYELGDKKIQQKPFDDEIKQTLVAILNFSKLLYESCTNRNLYNSYEHLNNLLNTTDIDVLESVLKLMLKPAQRVNNPKAVQSSFLAPQDKVTELARGGSIENLISTNTTLNNKINMSYYCTAAEEGDEGLQTVSIIADQSTSDQDLFWSTVKEHKIPADYHFELLNRIRIANHVNDEKVKNQLLMIRFISIVIMAHTMSETIAQNRVFIYEPQLVPQIAQLVCYDNHIPLDIQTYALYALDGIARHRSKVTEVLAAFNASANHGVLMHILRQISHANTIYTVEFLDALFTLLSFFFQTSAGGQMLMSAGIMSTLIQIMDSENYKSSLHVKTLIKVVGLLDTIMNNINTSFSSFCSANGLNSLLAVIKAQVDDCVKNPHDEHHDSITLIKNTLRFLIRMMESSDTADGLRNLIESSIPHTLKTVMDHHRVFGPSVFALVVNVATTFIHNEPTSLHVLQELDLPQTFLRTFIEYDQPICEVLMASVHAFGAICLNPAGLDMFTQARPLPHFFKLMTDKNFVNNPAEVGGVTQLGTTMDELIRHHPKLKGEVFFCANQLLLNVIQVGNSEEGKPMDNSHQLLYERQAEDMSNERAECLLLGHVDLVSRFLEGFLRNTANIKEFVTYGGPELLLSYYSLPMLPFNFSVSNAFDSLSFVFRVISDVSPMPFAKLVTAKVHEASKFLYQLDHGKSTVYEYTKIDGSNKKKLEEGNDLFRKCSILFGYIGLLSTVFANAILTSSKNSVKLVEWSLKQEGVWGTLIELLGGIHRIMVWQNILLRECVPKPWYITNNQQVPEDSSVDLKDPQVINVKRFKLLLSEVAPALMPVIQGIIKVSVSRRLTTTSSSEPSLYMRATLVAMDIAKAFKQSLLYMRDDSPVCKYDYYASMFSMISMLLLDDRSKTALETPIAVAFENIGNVDLLAKTLLDQFWKSAETQIEAGKQVEDGSELQRINTSIELLLAILHHLGSPKLFHNSPHTSIVTTLDPDAEYENRRPIDPYHWMASMQLKLSVLFKYLHSPHICKFSRHILHSLLRCLTQNMRVDGEKPKHPRVRRLAGRNSDETEENYLLDMGFDERLITTALAQFNNNYLCALDYLFSRRLVEHPVNDGAPILNIHINFPASNPLTTEEFNACVRILVNMWFDQALATDVLRETNNLSQAVATLSARGPSALITPSVSDQPTAPVAADEDNDDQYVDMDTDDDLTEIMAESDAEDSVNERLQHEKEVAKTLDECEAVRNTLRSEIPPILSKLVDTRNDIDFEIRDLMVALCCGDPEKATENTEKTIPAFVNTEDAGVDKATSAINKVRICALMLREPAMQGAVEFLIRLMSQFLDWSGFLNMLTEENNDSTDSKWVNTLFLILEAALAQADEPKDAEKEDNSPVFSSPESRSFLLKYCIRLLKLESLSQDTLISTLRIIVRLTKTHATAVEFVSLEGLKILLKRPSHSFEVIKIQQAYIIMILRHIIEDKSVLESCMHEWFTYWFTIPSSQYIDVSTFLSNNSNLVLRDPKVFLESTTKLCCLLDHKAEGKKSIRLIQNNGEKPSAPLNSQYSSIVVHYLLDQLVETQAKGDESTIKTGYTGFLLQCLLELITAYPSCRLDILTFNQSASNSSDTSKVSRVRQSILFTLVNTLLPYNAINPSTDAERKRQGVSMWVASILVAMCYDSANTTGNHVALSEVRNHVLDVVYRSFKEALQAGSASAKYIRYFVLAELCHRILNAPPANINPTASPALNSSKEEMVTAVAKLMLERKFVPVLISVISDVDVNYPHAKMILNSIMRPLEQLTKLAIRIDRSSHQDEDKADDKKDVDEENQHDIYLPMDTDGENEAAEEEVSDLYRNSSLAMYDGSVLEEEESDESSEDDIEMASSGDEIIEDGDDDSSHAASDGFETVDSSEEEEDEHEEEAGEDEEMDELIRSHRFHHSDTSGEEDDDSEDESDSDASSETNMSYASSSYGSSNESLNSDRSDSVHSDDSREMAWHLEDIRDNSGFLTRNEDNHGRRHGGRQTIHVETMTDTDEENGMDVDQSDLDEDQDSDDLDQEEIDDVERNLELFTRGFTGDSGLNPTPRNPTSNNLVNTGIGRSIDRDNIILHPLLRSTAVPNNAMSADTSSTPETAILTGTNSNHLQAYEDIIGGSAVRILENLLSQQQQRNNPSAVPETPLAPVAENDNQKDLKALNLLQDFQPMQTSARWTQAVQMVYIPSVASQKAERLRPALISKMTQIAEKAEQEVLSKQTPVEKEETMDVIEETAEEHAQLSGSSDIEEAILELDDIEEVLEDEEEEEQERVVVTINGEEVDITGTGIDAEFLEALPDDLRAEVLSQQMANRRTSIDSIDEDTISPEFLAALPDDIREEVIRHESMERNRRASRQQSTEPDRNHGSPLPQHNHQPLFENLRGSPRNVFDFSDTVATPQDNANMPTWRIGRGSSNSPLPASQNHASSSSNVGRKAMLHRDAIRIVDRSQLATLARLLFVPQSISKALLNRLLLNLCENSKTRGDLLSLLVCILQDGSSDLAAVDRSFNQMSIHTGKQVIEVTDKMVAEGADQPKLNDNAPNLITQRCLEILYYVVTWNDRSLAYFLTENDSFGHLKRHQSVNRKSKNKATASIKYPILILMGLLDRPAFSNNTALMGQLMNLLTTMCRPFPSLVKKYNEKMESKKTGDSAEIEKHYHHAPKPPTIPDQYLCKIVEVLSIGDCSSYTFQYTLSVLSYLSSLDGALDVIIDALVSTANSSGKQIIIDLQELLNILEKSQPGSELKSSALAQFSAATSYQTKLLRVLKAMGYLYTRKRNVSNKNEPEENEKLVLKVYNRLDFLPLWKKLGACLSVIQNREDLLNVATVLLPLVESFMAVSKYSTNKGYTATAETSSNPVEEFFFSFTEEHKKILNIMVRNNPSLMGGSFSLLVHNPKILEFDNKRSYFNQQLHKRTEPREHFPPLQLNVRRAHVFEDTYRQLQGRTGKEIKHGKLNVQFHNEEGVDAGGVAREWFSVLARQMFDVNYALFVTSAADKLTYQPNRASGVNFDHLSYFKCVGRIIGKAIHDGRLLDAYFTRSFYKLMLGRSVDYRDVEAVDPAYYKSLVWMLDNDITDIIDLTFSLETDDFGTNKIIDLKPNGRDIAVTEANKHEYVTLITEQKMVLAIKDQVNAFLEGFHDIIPAQLIQIFNEQELELLISGLPDIDIDEWKANTVYEGYTLSSPQVQWFWRAVRSFDQEERAKLLQFSTGTSKVPLEGFSGLQGSDGVQKFQIHKEFGDVQRLPSAHTCFNQIDLPQYLSYEDLRSNLFKAISECSTGFAFQ